MLSLINKKHSGCDYQFGCVFIKLNIPTWEDLVSHIDEFDLYLPEDPAHGVESDPHVSILYGLISEKIIDKEIFEIIEKVNSQDIKIEISGINIFENGTFDVVKMEVHSDYLLSLNKEFKKLPHVSQFYDYNPHITMAYLLPGCGRKYINNEYINSFNEVHNIVYSKPNGEVIEYSI